jgi:hypothetical protein
MRIGDAAEDDRCQLLIPFARGIAQYAGLVPRNTPLLMIDRVFQRIRTACAFTRPRTAPPRPGRTL